MIQEVSGDILLSRADAIAHGVAPKDHFDHGLALSLRERWPSMVKDFRHWSHTHHEKAGGLWGWAGADGHRVISLLTQDAAPDDKSRPGRAKLEHVNHALKALREYCVREKITSLALPKLATGVGGLTWDEVKPLVQQHLGSLDIPVFVYTTYRKGERSPE